MEEKVASVTIGADGSKHALLVRVGSNGRVRSELNRTSVGNVGGGRD